MPDNSSAQKNVSPWLLGFFLAYFGGILPVFAWGLWSLIDKNTFPVNAAPGADTKLILDQGQLLLAVMLAGGIGSYIHGVNSFVTYVGNRSFVSSWAPWYALRPFMGIAMSVIFYVVVRGGVLVMSGGVSSVDPYAMMTVAALAGMFSKQASDKLAEVFDTLFRSRGDEDRGDKLEKPELKLTALNPKSVAAGSDDTVITVTGTGFASDAVVKFDDGERKTTVNSATELTFTLLAAEIAAAGEHTVVVVNPAAGGAASNELKLAVTAVPPPGGAGTSVQVPAVVRENSEGDLEVVSVAPGASDAEDESGETVAAGNAGNEDEAVG
ncbi:MAG TPA: IPT/TIG domain-containing protein [Longimicrobium sp.]|nr:IPT/TIG domain-containing protein [Longimicrobium sp.]